ncbi:hypothetical protein [Nocardiopsis sp. FR26]|uniref:hypothetical protein n=1 Tax=Nocardiopsis sp. FR26 TaxID=2605987 RepID=UPI00135B7BD6|nr:hypothetical protein [Nocardiopsis sp. FR26]
MVDAPSTLIRAASGVVIVGAAVIAFAALAGGCAPETGEVTDRDYSPAWTSTTTSCSTTGQTRTCTPHTSYHPESYTLRLDDGQDAGWREVAPSEYERCHVGDHYPACARGDRS